MDEADEDDFQPRVFSPQDDNLITEDENLITEDENLITEDDNPSSDIIKSSPFTVLMNRAQSRHFEEIYREGDWDPSEEAVQNKYKADAILVAMSSDAEYSLDSGQSNLELPQENDIQLDTGDRRPRPAGDRYRPQNKGCWGMDHYHVQGKRNN
ncbi:hypothetical protein FPOAC2_01122 [Fusarium poae]